MIAKEPKKEAKGFFSQKLITFVISCEELNSNVKRNIDDFYWFKFKVNQLYPFILVPSILDNSIFLKYINDEKKELEIKCDYINKFFEAFLRKKILRTSKLLYFFLTLDDKEFEKFKKQVLQNKFILNVTLNNLKTIKGEVKINLNNEN